jgi:hypothetical protein
MFGRRRPAAEAMPLVVAASAEAEPRRAECATAPIASTGLSDAQMFVLLHERLAATFGDGGSWTVRRRTTEDTDDLFRSVFVDQLADDLAGVLHDARSRVGASVQVEASDAAAVGAVAASDDTRRPRESADVAADLDSASSPSDAAVVDTIPVSLSTEAASDSHATPSASGGPLADDRAPSDDDVRSPSHRHDEAQGDEDAVLDEDTLALRWTPAPITVWTDLKRPVTGEIALELLHSTGR